MAVELGPYSPSAVQSGVRTRRRAGRAGLGRRDCGSSRCRTRPRSRLAETTLVRAVHPGPPLLPQKMSIARRSKTAWARVALDRRTAYRSSRRRRARRLTGCRGRRSTSRPTPEPARHRRQGGRDRKHYREESTNAEPSWDRYWRTHLPCLKISSVRSSIATTADAASPRTLPSQPACEAGSAWRSWQITALGCSSEPAGTL